jgi:hypothetical protein
VYSRLSLFTGLYGHHHEEEWDDHDFDRYSALKAVDTGEGAYDFFVNMDNVYLCTELKASSPDAEPQLMEAQFKYALVLIGLALLKDENEDTGQREQATIEDDVYNTTRMIAPVLLPMIDTLGGLVLDEIAAE